MTAEIPLDDAVRNVGDWLRNGENCVLFLGAAISARSEPSSTAGVPSADELKGLMERPATENLRLAFDCYVERRDRGALKDFLLNHFFSDDIRKLAPKDIHYKLARLPFRTIVTTNWDRLMEEALESAWKNAQVIVFDEDLRGLGNLDVTVIKPHGCVERAHRIGSPNADDLFVCTSAQYREFRQKRPNIAAWLTAIMATHHVIFLGYGGEDENLNNIIADGSRGDPLTPLGPYSPPKCLAVLGDEEQNGFGRFGARRIDWVRSTGDHFVERLLENFYRAQGDSTFMKAESTKMVVMRIQNRIVPIPEVLLKNCVWGVIIGVFPREWLTWNLEERELTAARDWIQQLYSEGSLQTVITAEGLWYRFSDPILSYLSRQLRRRPRLRNTLEEIRNNYFEFLKSQAAAKGSRP